MMRDSMVICDMCGAELGDYDAIRHCKNCDLTFIFGLKVPDK